MQHKKGLKHPTESGAGFGKKSKLNVSFSANSCVTGQGSVINWACDTLGAQSFMAQQLLDNL